MMSPLLQAVALVLLAVAGTIVVLVRSPLRQAIAVAYFGLQLAVVFFTFQAPDVALSAIAVSAVGLPMMILLALARIRRQSG